jgi:hypothetical protein
MPTLIDPPKKRETDLGDAVPKSQFFYVIRGAVRIAPSFIVLATAATGITYLLGIPPTERAVAASVPTIVLFLIIRLSMIVFPQPPQDAGPKGTPTVTLVILTLVMLLSALATVDLLISSAAFSVLGFHDLAAGALNVAFRASVTCSMTFVFTIIDVLHSMGVGLEELIVFVIWKFFGYPSQLAEHLFAAQ